MPTFYYLKENVVVQREIASPTQEIMPGVLWGDPDVLFTPAFWLGQYWMREDTGLHSRPHALGQTLEEEVVACLLGGYGIPAEVGLAAFVRLKSRGLISHEGTKSDLILRSLAEPLTVSGRPVNYRFSSQKARYVVAALRVLHERPAPLNSALSLRQYLLGLPGVGFKIASWVVRNWLGSSEVAILDIHLVRAGRLMNLFSASDDVARNYLNMEERFLKLADAMQARAADLDALIWFEMRRTPRLVAKLLRQLD